MENEYRPAAARKLASSVLPAGVAAIVLGIAALTLSRSFDSFVKGLFLGAGIALVLIGVYVAARSRSIAGRITDNGTSKSDWLPSRDNDR